MGSDLALVNAVVEYHVIPGVIDSSAAFAADGVSLTSIMGASFTVDVLYNARSAVVLIDNEPDVNNARLDQRDLDNFTSNGAWHGISRVLIPIDL
ncbi:MAG: fasciclin domain-containing protein [Acidimicrobiia bacterium]|nr:fasciclin domain-containing protein [Acidimicrobiia bacterium]